MTEKSSHRQILRSSYIIGGASVVNILISLLRTKIVALLLGPAGIGLIGLLQNLMGTVAVISGLGLNNVGTRQIAEAVGKEDQVGVDSARRALFWGTMFLAILGGIVTWALRHVLADKVLYDPSMASSVGWLGVGVALTVASGSQGALLTGMRRIGDIAWSQILSAFVSTILGVSCIWLLGEKGLILYILSVPLVAFAIGNIFVARLPKKQSAGVRFFMLARQWRIMARLGMAFMLAGVIGMLGQLVVRTLVQRELGAEGLGYFQAAFAISMTYMGFISGAMATDYYPRLTAIIHDSVKSNKLVNEQSEVAILLAGPILLAMLALAPWVIKFLYSNEFTAATSVLRWQVIGDVIKIVSWPMGYLILASGSGRIFLFSELIAMSIFAIVTWLALPKFGINAAGISFFVMYAAYLPTIFYFANRRTGFRWSTAVKHYFSLLFLLAILVFFVGFWSIYLSAGMGLMLSVVFGIVSFMRLADKAELGGPVGKIANVTRKFFLNYSTF